jgi:hypothetical protein
MELCHNYVDSLVEGKLSVTSGYMCYLFLHGGAITWSDVYQWNCVIMPRFLELKKAAHRSLSFMPYLFDISMFLLTIFLAVNALYT